MRILRNLYPEITLLFTAAVSMAAGAFIMILMTN